MDNKTMFDKAKDPENRSKKYCVCGGHSHKDVKKLIKETVNYNQLLFVSIRNNDLEGVKKSIENGADIRSNDETSLTISCSNGNLDIVKYLVDNGVEFIWETKVTNIDFENQLVSLGVVDEMSYDRLIFGVGKSGIDFGKALAEEYKLPTEPKTVQIGVRFEAPQKHFQKLIDISYDFKLYRKYDSKCV